ncbi:MAG: GNAT family protein [Bacteroidales bacterium]|jgi:RimJ/RimL family protein N-acetyltransferase
MQIKINTPRFTLQELSVDNVNERYLSWFNEEAAQKYISASTVTKSLMDLKDYVRKHTGRQDILFLGIFDKVTGQHIGNIKYEPVDSLQAYAIMGILIGETDYRGKGVAVEVLNASALWLKENRNINQLILGVNRNNAGAVKSYEKAGFAIEETPFLKAKSPDSLIMVWHLY